MNGELKANHAMIPEFSQDGSSAGTTNYSLRFTKDFAIDLFVAKDVFVPTYTTVLCVAAALKTLKRPGRVLDLGCGCGAVGIALAKKNLALSPIFASDISPAATNLAKANFGMHGIACDVRLGSVLDPWEGMEFDCIIDDISGITEEIARLSPWFSNNIPCASGWDGAELTVEVIRRSKAHIDDCGLLFIPVVSLSNGSRIIDEAKETFWKVEKVASQVWRLPDEMLPYLDKLRALKIEGRASFDEKFGTVLCSTEIYMCTN